MDWDTIIKEFIALWVVIDPIGSIPVFIAVTAGLSAAAQRKVAIKAIAVSAAILLFFLVGGQVLLEALDIHPVVSKVFAFEQLGDAFRLQENHGHFGKICVALSNG